MKMLILFINCFLMIILMVGCQGDQTQMIEPEASMPATTSMLDPTLQTTRTPVPPSPTAKEVFTETAVLEEVETDLPTTTATIPAEARLSVQCLDVAPTLPSDIISSGVVVMESREHVVGRFGRDTFLIDMATGQSTQIALPGEIQGSHSVTPNRKRMAYSSVIFDAEGKIIREELVIADASGYRLKVIPWEENWVFSPGWLDNERLVFILAAADVEENTLRKPGSRLVLNPFSSERQILRPDYPRFLHIPSTVLPDWEGWLGVMFDPSLTLAIYPRFIGNDEERYTYAIWDLTKGRLVASLESIFSTYSLYNSFPLPRWSPDGSHFVFVGVIAAAKETDPVEFELYRVSRDGQAERLTHLAGTANLWGSNYSWSPDGRYIAMFLGPPLAAAFEKPRVAVLDAVTLEVTDFCLPVTSEHGVDLPPSPPIWSPDGKQFLVFDWDDKEHSSVILVDISQGFAAKIAEDMEPVGWMVGAGE